MPAGRRTSGSIGPGGLSLPVGQPRRLAGRRSRFQPPRWQWAPEEPAARAATPGGEEHRPSQESLCGRFFPLPTRTPAKIWYRPPDGSIRFPLFAGKLSVPPVQVVGMEEVVVGSVSELRTAVDAARKMVGNELWSCSGTAVTELLARVHRLRAQVESMELDLIREVDSRGIPGEVGAIDTRAYLIGALTMSPAEAATTVKLAQAFGSRLVDTGEALAEGRICR